MENTEGEQRARGRTQKKLAGRDGVPLQNFRKMQKKKTARAGCESPCRNIADGR